MLPGHEQHHTQDFVCRTGKAFGAADAETFLRQVLFFEKHATDSATLKVAVSTAARLAESAIEASWWTNRNVTTVWPSGDTHPWRILLQPDTPSLWNLHRENRVRSGLEQSDCSQEQKLEQPGNYSAIRDAVVRFFKTERAQWDVCAQLATDLERTPIEEATAVWPEELSPYVPVARLVAEPQEAYSAARRIFVDEHLSFSPCTGYSLISLLAT